MLHAHEELLKALQTDVTAHRDDYTWSRGQYITFYILRLIRDYQLANHPEKAMQNARAWADRLIERGKTDEQAQSRERVRAWADKLVSELTD